MIFVSTLVNDLKAVWNTGTGTKGDVTFDQFTDLMLGGMASLVSSMGPNVFPEISAIWLGAGHVGRPLPVSGRTFMIGKSKKGGDPHRASCLDELASHYQLFLRSRVSSGLFTEKLTEPNLHLRRIHIFPKLQIGFGGKVNTGHPSKAQAYQAGIALVSSVSLAAIKSDCPPNYVRLYSGVNIGSPGTFGSGMQRVGVEKPQQVIWNPAQFNPPNKPMMAAWDIEPVRMVNNFSLT